MIAALIFTAILGSPPAPPVVLDAERVPSESSRPNVFKGYDYKTPGGDVQSLPNVFGGHDYHYPDGRVVRCRPNAVTKGEDCE